MDLRSLLGMNLRRLCEREESIASVCRKLGINRQQFNNYLSGRNLPNETVVRQLCEYFAIEPHELFLPRDHCATPPADPATGRFVARLLGSQAPHPDLPNPGTYFVYFEAPFDPTALVRSYMEVHERDGARTFSRLTRIPVNGQRPRTTLWSRHDGFVRAERGTVHWSGYNVRTAGRPSLLVGRFISTPPILYTGIGLIDTGDGTESVGFAITRAPERSLDVMRSLGLVTTSSTPSTRVALRAIHGYRSAFYRSYAAGSRAE